MISVFHLRGPRKLLTYKIIEYIVAGISTLIWVCIWIMFVGNDPSTDKFITKAERDHLSREIDYISKDKVSYP